jgi:hypothetical protein
MESTSVVSPGGWLVPVGGKPGWEWVPPAGARPRLDRMPRRVRILFWTPFLDRRAHVWMWFHGGWDVDPPADLTPAVAGVAAGGAGRRIPAAALPAPGGFCGTRSTAEFDRP